MRSIHQRGPVRAQASLTPMIDVVFLLVVFFVAVSQLVDREPNELPHWLLKLRNAVKQILVPAKHFADFPSHRSHL